jgi:RNA polymerase-binding transcription factor DksA
MTMTQERAARTTYPAGVLVPRAAEPRADGWRTMPEAAWRTMPEASWRTVLEARWRERLDELTELCVAFHEAGGQAMIRQPNPSLRHLTRRAVHARQALAETDAALKRLTGGRFGECEDCAAQIPASSLTDVPETRYCPTCAA